MKKQTFKLHSASNLISYMKKFSIIEKTLLFEIKDDKIIAKTHTPDKAVVKIGSVLVTDILDFLPKKDSEEIEDVKIGLFAVDNFISSFKHFDDKEITLEIVSAEIEVDGKKENTGTELKAKSKQLKVNFPCASPSMFRYIDEKLTKTLTDTKESIFSFRIDLSRNRYDRC